MNATTRMKIAALLQQVNDYYQEKMGMMAIAPVALIEPRKDNRTVYNRFLVTNALGWGFGDTIAEAKKNALKDVRAAERKVLINRAALVAEETTCDSSGGISYHAKTPPVELGLV